MQIKQILEAVRFKECEDADGKLWLMGAFSLGTQAPLTPENEAVAKFIDPDKARQIAAHDISLALYQSCMGDVIDNLLKLNAHLHTLKSHTNDDTVLEMLDYVESNLQELVKHYTVSEDDMQSFKPTIIKNDT